MSSQTRSGATVVVVASTVMLSFISFWRAAAIVLSDLASSAYYAGGIAEVAIGPAAPWFVLGVMLFSFAAGAVYLESCSMFVRGGVYVVVRDALGPFLARLSVSAAIFDYVLTGPISGVSAGLYLASLMNDISHAAGSQLQVPEQYFAAIFAIVVTIYFWRSNVRGIHESSTRALRIMQITTGMFVILLLWSLFTLIVRGPAQIPPPPTAANLHFSKEGLGWLKGTIWPAIPFVAIVIAFGHSLLAMSGFETLAQVYREISYPKLKNLKITCLIVCVYSVVCTGFITVIAAMVIPDASRMQYANNLLGGLTMHLIGPLPFRLAFQGIVVAAGVLILSGAVNTSLIGSNSVLNRVAEDGVLLPWFRKPHPRFGTTYRMLNIVMVLQVFTIAVSRGNVILIGEAYAFGVIWSFFLKSLAVLVIRFRRNDQEYKMPLNIRVGGREWPIGLITTTIALGFVAIANLFTKEIATEFGIAFTVLVFIVFTISQRLNDRKTDASLEQFNLKIAEELNPELVRARPGCIVVAVRDFKRLHTLRTILERTNLRRHDIVVMTVRDPENADHPFTDYEQELFSRVVTLAEKEGKPVELLVVPAVNAFDAMVQTAHRLQASKLVTGVSEQMPTSELARRIGLAWEQLPEPRQPFSLEIIAAGRPSQYINLGPHPPRLWPEDIDKLHELWLRLSAEFGSKLHHRDVISVALERLEDDLNSDRRNEVFERLSCLQDHDREAVA